MMVNKRRFLNFATRPGSFLSLMAESSPLFRGSILSKGARNYAAPQLLIPIAFFSMIEVEYHLLVQPIEW